jgi:hypothetical protein
MGAAAAALENTSAWPLGGLGWGALGGVQVAGPLSRGDSPGTQFWPPAFKQARMHADCWTWRASYPPQARHLQPAGSCTLYAALRAPCMVPSMHDMVLQ